MVSSAGTTRERVSIARQRSRARGAAMYLIVFWVFFWTKVWTCGTSVVGWVVPLVWLQRSERRFVGDSFRRGYCMVAHKEVQRVLV